MFNSALWEVIKEIQNVLEAIGDSLTSQRKNHSSLQSRVDQLTTKNNTLSKQLEQSNSRAGLLNERIMYLEQYLGVEFVREATQGYKKVKKTKKTK